MWFDCVVCKSLIKGSEPKPGQSYLVICSTCIDNQNAGVILNESQVRKIKAFQIFVWVFAAIMYPYVMLGFCHTPESAVAYSLIGCVSWGMCIYLGAKLYLEDR
jgi:hypothetical protein